MHSSRRQRIIRADSSAGPGGGPQVAMASNAILGVSVDEYTPYVMDETSAGPNPTTFDLFNGTGSDGNVYLTGTLGPDTINASVDAVNANLIHCVGSGARISSQQPSG